MRAIVQRHGKIIMTILGVSLMFIFALPTFRAPSTDRASMPAGKLNGRKVSQDDLDVARAELHILQGLRLFEYTQAYDQAGTVVNAFASDENEKAIYWYLLCHEAAKYGMAYISNDDVLQMLQNLGQTDVMIEAQLRAAGLSRRDLSPAVTNLEIVSNYLQFLANQPRSVAAMELSADQELSKLKVAFATLDATQGWEQAATPSDEQIKKQFDLYKGVVRTRIPAALPAPTTAPSLDEPIAAPPPLPAIVDGHHYPFGYKYPDRVKVDYVVFKRAVIRAGMKLTQEDIDNADKYYFNHQDEFRNVIPTTVPSSQPAASQAATMPAIKPLKEVQEKLRERQIDLRVNAALKKMTDRFLALAAEPWKAMPFDDKGFRDPLVQSSWADYAKLAEDLSKSRDFGGYKPEIEKSNALLSAEGLAGLKNIGSASYRLPNQAMEFPFPDLATNVRELAELKSRSPLGRLSLQIGMEGPPLQDKDGNVYIYRVTEASKTHEPTDKEFDEIRPQVVEDLKKLATYEKRQAEAKELAAAANRGDLTAIAQQKNLPVVTTSPFSRLDISQAREVGSIRGFVDAAFALATSAATQPAASTQPGANGATSVLSADESLRAYVLQVVNQTPATGADFGGHRRTLFQESDPAIGEFLRNYITLEPLAARLKYVPTVPFPKPRVDE